MVARLRSGSEATDGAHRAIEVTRWLADQGVGVTEPADVEQPQVVGPYVVTFWNFYEQGDRRPPAAVELGRILRLLHATPPPPMTLPTFAPLRGFDRLVTESTVLTKSERDWLHDRRLTLLDQCEHLDWVLEHGHIHGDAYPGNLLWRGDVVVLGDWDDTAIGPRELDLANTYQGARFGRTRVELDSFAAAYGTDLSGWPGLDVLIAIRDLHTLGTFIRRATAGSDAAGLELSHRVQTLRADDRTAAWTAT